MITDAGITKIAQLLTGDAAGAITHNAVGSLGTVVDNAEYATDAAAKTAWPKTAGTQAADATSEPYRIKQGSYSMKLTVEV